MKLHHILDKIVIHSEEFYATDKQTRNNWFKKNRWISVDWPLVITPGFVKSVDDQENIVFNHRK